METASMRKMPDYFMCSECLPPELNFLIFFSSSVFSALFLFSVAIDHLPVSVR